MIYIHELESVLSSIFLVCSSFSLSPPSHDQYHASQPSRSMAKNSHFPRAFTLIELIVVLAIIAILMSMVYPMYTSISERAKATKDMSNLRQIGIATQTYLNDSDGVFFALRRRMDVAADIQNIFLDGEIFQSPFDKRASSEARRVQRDQLRFERQYLYQAASSNAGLLANRSQIHRRLSYLPRRKLREQRNIQGRHIRCSGDCLQRMTQPRLHSAERTIAANKSTLFLPTCTLKPCLGLNSSWTTIPTIQAQHAMGSISLGYP